MAVLNGTEDINLLPLSPPPQGVTSNFVNPSNRAYQTHIVAAVCLTIIVVFVSLRLYAKLCLLPIRKSDYAYILSVTAAIVQILLFTIISVGSVYGRHSWDALIGEMSVTQIQISLTIQLSYSPCVWMIKLSLFLLFLETFGSLRWLKLLRYAGILVTGIFHASIMIALAVSCVPRHGHSKVDYFTARWAPACVGNNYLTSWPGLFNIFSDFYLLVLPLPAIWHLQIPIGKKVGIIIMFLTGLLACFCSIFGVIIRSCLQDHVDDGMWYFVPVSCAVMGEVTAGVIIPSVPAANAVYRHLKPAVSGHTSTFRRSLRRIPSSKTTNNVKMEDNLGMRFDRDRYYMIDEVPMKDHRINAAAIIVRPTVQSIRHSNADRHTDLG